MKTKNTSPLLRRATTASLVFALLGFTLNIRAQSWDGGDATSNGWGSGNNWNPNGVPAFTNTTDIVINSLTRPTNAISGNRIVRSISYGAAVDGTFGTNFQNFNGGSTAQTLTFDTDVVGGNATVNVDADASGNITLGNAGSGGTNGNFILADNLVVNHDGSGVLNFNRPINAGAFNLTKNGSGTMNIVNSALTGDLNINEGTLAATGFNAGNDANVFTNINVAGGKFQIQNFGFNTNKVYNNQINVTSSSTIEYFSTAANASYTLLIGGTTTLNLAADVTVSNISTDTSLAHLINISRNVTGTGNMTVSTFNNVNSSSASFYNGRVALGGANSGWSGDLIVAGGTAEVYGDSSLGQVNLGTGDVILGETDNAFGAGLLLSAGTTGGKTLANDFIVRSGGYRTIRGGSDNTYTLSGNITLEGELNVHNGLFFTDKNMILSGAISGVGGLDLTSSSISGFIRLSGNNTYSGNTTIGANAKLNIVGGQAIGDHSAVSFVGSGSSLTFNADGETVGSIASTGSDGTINLGANTLTTGGDNTNTTYGGAINGTGNLNKVGNGTFTLVGAKAYTGTTTVSAGTLSLASDATLASENIQVAEAATLDVSALAGGLTIANGHRIGGDGTITGNLILSLGAELVLSLTETLTVSGTVALDDSFGIVSLVNADGSEIDWSLVGNGTYELIDTMSTFENITNFGLAEAANIGDGRSAYFANGSLSLVVVPEPSTAFLLIGSVGLVALLRRRFR